MSHVDLVQMLDIVDLDAGTTVAGKLLLMSSLCLLPPVCKLCLYRHTAQTGNQLSSCYQHQKHSGAATLLSAAGCANCLLSMLSDRACEQRDLCQSMFELHTCCTTKTAEDAGPACME